MTDEGLANYPIDFDLIDDMMEPFPQRTLTKGQLKVLRKRLSKS